MQLKETGEIPDLFVYQEDFEEFLKYHYLYNKCFKKQTEENALDYL